MTLSPVILSFKTSIISTIITFFLGILAANIVKDLKRFRGVVDGLFTLPLILPPTVVGFFLLIFLGTNGPFSAIYQKFNFQIVFSYSSTIIAAVIVSFPLMYRTALGAFDQVDKDYIYAARTLGISEWQIFTKILIPLSKPGLTSGVILSFSRALGEFGATIMIAGNIPGRTQTISTAIYSAVQAGNRMLAFKWSFIVISISFISLLAVNFYGEKRVAP